MKGLISILLSSLILSVSLQNTGLLVSFKINQSYIAEYLCVNKDKPELNCAGSCHLKNQLEKVNPVDENKSTPVFNETKDLVLFNVVCKEINKSYNYSDLSIFKSNEEIKYFEFSNSCFHPPKELLV